jgi:hypothetical protein
MNASCTDRGRRRRIRADAGEVRASEIAPIAATAARPNPIHAAIRVYFSREAALIVKENAAKHHDEEQKLRPGLYEPTSRMIARTKPPAMLLA